MADNVVIKDAASANAVIGTDEVNDSTLGNVQIQYMKLMDGTLGSTNKLNINSEGRIAANIAGRTVTGNINASNANVTIDCNDAGHIGIYLGPTTTLSGTELYEATIDGTNWFQAYDQSNNNGPNNGGPLNTGANVVRVEGFVKFRIRCSSYTSGFDLATLSTSAAAPSGTFDNDGNMWVNVSNLPSVVSRNNGATDASTLRVTLSNDSTGQVKLTTGTSTIGNVNLNESTLTLGNVGLNTGTNTIGAVNLNNSTASLGNINLRFANISASVNNGTVDTGTMRVTLASNGTGVVGLNAGTNNIGNVVTQGTTAQGTAVAGNPILNGGRAATANPPAVTNGQNSAIMVDKLGRMVVIQGHIRDLTAGNALTITANTSARTLITNQGAGIFADITSLTVTNGNATPTAVTLSDGTKSYIYNVAGGGGFTIPFSPPLPATTANVAWTLACGTSVTSIYCNVVFVDNL